MSKQSIASWFIGKWKQRQAESGTFQAASNMRKQGIPLSIALAVLAHGVTQ